MKGHQELAEVGRRGHAGQRNNGPGSGGEKRLVGRGRWSLRARQWHQEMKLERDSRASTGAQRLSLSGPGQIWAVTQRRGIVVFWLNCCACRVDRRLGRSLFYEISWGWADCRAETGLRALCVEQPLPPRDNPDARALLPSPF